MALRLHREQPRLGRGIGLEPVITVEMIGRDVEQHRDIAIERLRQVDLIARQLQHIDAALRQRLLLKDRQPDVSAESRRNAGGLQNVVDQRDGSGLTVRAGNADDLVRRQRGARLGEELDVADDGRVFGAGERRDVVGIERHARRNDKRIVFSEVIHFEVRYFQRSPAKAGVQLRPISYLGAAPLENPHLSA